MSRRALGALSAAILWSALGAPAAALATSPNTPVRVVFETQGGEVPIFAEVAGTPARQRIGLMYRLYLPPGTGMLFPMRRARVQSFWMHNTLIPLDMVFVDEDLRIVGVIHRAEPLTDTPRHTERASLYIIELPGGWARLAGIKVGDGVRYEALD